MKPQKVFYAILILSMVLISGIGSPRLQVAKASPEGPTGTEDTEAVATISKPIIVFPGLTRGELDGGDTDITPVAPSLPNDPNVIGAVPDTTGAVGHTHYLQAVNKSLRLFLKDGTPIDGVPINTFWANGLAATNTICDGQFTAHHGQPYVVYDHLTARWVVVDVAYQNINTGPYFLCIAVSSGRPAPVVPGPYFFNAPPAIINWFFYGIQVLGPALENFYPDNPKVGVWDDGYYISADLLDIENDGLWRNPEGVIVWAINKNNAITGVLNNDLRPIAVPIYEGIGFENLVPTNLLGAPPSPGTPNYFASIQPGRFHIWEFDVNWANNTFTFGLGPAHTPNVTINTDTAGIWGEGFLVPEPLQIEQVNAMGHRLTSPLQFRIVNGNPSLWASHTVYNGTTTGIRWYELQFGQDSVPYIYQVGTEQPNDGNFRWLPSMAVDKAGDMAIAYNLDNSSTIYPSIYYTGRLADDVPGLLTQGEYILDLPGVPNPYNAAQYDTDFTPDGPWGRQSQMTVDPTDNCVFWFTSMYYSDPELDGYDGFTWYTRIGAFTFPECRAGQLRRISLHTNNTQGNNTSGFGMDLEMYSVATSEDSRYSVFPSDATNLINGDTNHLRDIFLRDRDADNDGLFDEPGGVKTFRIPIHTTDGTDQPNGNSFEVSISNNGRFVVFSSEANNLVTGDTNGSLDIFLFDRDADNDGIFDELGLTETATKRISVSTSGAQTFGISKQPFISGNGRFVAFSSNSSNLDTTPVDLNGKFDIFIRDRDTDKDGIFDEPTAVSTERVSLPSTPTVGEGNGDSIQPTLSDDGHFLSFSSYSNNLAPVNLADGNTFQDVYLRDLIHGQNFLASVQTANAGIGANRSYTPYISGNGAYVVYASEAILDPVLDTNVFADIYLSVNPMINSDDTTFVYDPTLVVTTLISVNFAQQVGNNNSYSPSINRDGTQIAFASHASNLDPFLPDLNNRRDIYLYDMSSSITGIGMFGTMQRISLSVTLGNPNDDSYVPIVAPGGNHVVFVSEASNLVFNDTNFVYDVFAYDGDRTLPVFLKILGNTTPVGLGGLVDVHVVFNANQYEIDSFAFSIDFDQQCLSYQTFSFPSVPGFFFGLTPDLLDLDGELDVNIYSSPTHVAMPDGTTVLTITFRVLPTCNVWAGLLNIARVSFSQNPAASFGSYGQSVRGIVLNGFVRIGNGIPGDCNGNGFVEAADLQAEVLEIFDGDGNLPEDTPLGSFGGNPVGCNSNADSIVDAGDISCTVDIIFHGSSAACLSGSTSPPVPKISQEDTTAGTVQLTMPQDLLAPAGTIVYVPVTLNPSGNLVNSVIFSVDLDQNWLSFDPNDYNGDGYPDSIFWNLPASYARGVSYDPTDQNGELDFVLYNFSNTGTSLPTGMILTLALGTRTPSGNMRVYLPSSNDPAASFGSATGQSLSGTFGGGSLWMTLQRILFLPFVKR